ncbi:MAG: putative membrane protein YhiD involved in acid resistance [Planctomycetota bacterium]
MVRFRTPIKEPEELAYLFLAIAMGLGLGADQTVPTVSATMLILLLVAILRWVRSGKETRNLYLSIEISEGDQPSEHLNRLNEVIGRHTESSDLRRMDKRPEGLEFTFLLDLDESHQLASLVEELNGSFPGIGLTFIDQNQLPAL